MNILKPLHILLVFLCLGISAVGFSQVKEREKLEQERIRLQKQIKEINTLLTNTQNKEKSVINEVEDLDRRIRTTENLIKVTNQEANLLTREINTNLNKVQKLRKDLENLKEDYAKMIQKSYKSKSQQSRIMFLFSSESFLQAYKRLQYMKQYTNYRKEQGEEIKKQTLALQQLNKDLAEQKKAKEQLLAENRETREKLRKDKEQQQELIASIQIKEGEIEQQLKAKQAEIDKVNRQIEEVIRAAIAEENKKRGSTSKTEFALTPEAKALAADFTANKGKLPWPVRSGVLTMKYGRNPNPIRKSISIMSNGVRIQTNESEPVKAVFKGEVYKIQIIKGANKLVYIRHGDYMTVYGNLSEVNVKAGDPISTGQIVGRVGISYSTKRPTLKFVIYKNAQTLDPALWIYKM
ncbi:murein hydrolase activator EnvC family protein [Mesonia aquimarina]|uniref:murein hydrolase activator EnvC family protein n=1 Tax=Mesonia aquimarina TaxID=1504967 RepID=UPI000EF579A1|nr:peptidoglycan DD-metalloendopeptidase family protein [Mesonia aquimarina]